MRRRRNVHLPEANINLTSLLDITFVLLISFMVVAPALRYSVDLELPKVEESRKTSEKKPVTVGVTWDDRSGTLYFLNGQVSPLDDLPDRIKSITGYDPKEVVALEADRRVPWEDMARLINQLKLEDIHNIGIVTERGSR